MNWFRRWRQKPVDTRRRGLVEITFKNPFVPGVRVRHFEVRLIERAGDMVRIEIPDPEVVRLLGEWHPEGCVRWLDEVASAVIIEQLS